MQDYTDLRTGDIVRYVLTSGHDEHDYIVTDIDTTPRDLTDGQLLTFPAWRLHVTMLVRPSAGAPSRFIGDLEVRGASTRIVDSADTLVRADRRLAPAVVEFVASGQAGGRR